MSAKFTVMRMLRVVEEFKQLDNDIQTDTIQVFLLIAANAGISSREILDATGISQSSVSRHLAVLSEWNWKGGPGLGLCETLEDPTNRRSKRSWLTQKGRQFAAKIVRMIDTAMDVDLTDFPTSKEMGRSSRSGAR